MTFCRKYSNIKLPHKIQIFFCDRFLFLLKVFCAMLLLYRKLSSLSSIFTEKVL
nr:MAG TPA: hypothetical protein [Caudoviricetes sp.]